MADKKVPAFNEIGKSAKELLYGAKDGVFQYDKLISLQSKTADGLEFTVSSRVKDSNIEQSLAASYKTDKYSVLAQINPAGKIITSLSLVNPVPNVTVALSGAVPDPQTGKLGIDWTVPNLTVKAAVGLTNQPKVDLAVTTGRMDYVLGGAALYDTATGNVSTWSLGAGYTSLDYQVGLIVTDGDAAKVMYAHNIDPTQTIGGEAIKNLSKETTTFTLAYAKKLQDSSLFKARLSNNGIAALLYQTDIQPKTTLTHTLQFDATNLNAAPKFGLALGVKP